MIRDGEGDGSGRQLRRGRRAKVQVTLDAWIETPDRDRLTDSAVHGSVQYRPITRHDVVGGYLNLRGLDEVADALKEGML